jgi:glutamate synthase domain-containing protein 3
MIVVIREFEVMNPPQAVGRLHPLATAHQDITAAQRGKLRLSTFETIQRKVAYIMIPSYNSERQERSQNKTV